MAKRLFLACFCLFYNLSFCQYKVICNSDTKKPVPYVNIWIDSQLGTTANEQGSFNLHDNAGNAKVRFSSVGYKDKVLNAAELKDTVFLDPEIYKLNNIDIYAQNKKSVKLGKLKNSGREVCVTPPYEMRIIGRSFMYKKEYANTKFIKSVSVKTFAEIDNGVLNLQFYSLNENGEPKDRIFNQNIIFSVSSGDNKASKIDVLKYFIEFPENGIFVAVENLLLDQNKYPLYYKTKADEVKEIIIYEPRIKVTDLSGAPDTWTFDGKTWLLNLKNHMIMQLELSN
jgi:hypothetical protein